MWNAGPESVRWISIGTRKADFDIGDILKFITVRAREAEQTANRRETDPNRTELIELLC